MREQSAFVDVRGWEIGVERKSVGNERRNRRICICVSASHRHVGYHTPWGFHQLKRKSNS